MTLREFLKIARGEQYRIYQPNRDCLIFESYFKIHSPYYFDDKHGVLQFNKKYWDKNDYCDIVYSKGFKYPEVDKETKIFLEKFGDMEVVLVECSSCLPHRISCDKNGNLNIKPVKDSYHPHENHVPCFNIFIANNVTPGYFDCVNCHHRIYQEKKDIYGPDSKDAVCDLCPRNNKKETDVK